MTVTPSTLTIEIHQGASLIEDFERAFYPYEVVWDCGQWLKKCTGLPAPDADRVLEDYTDCSAVAVMVPDIGAPEDDEIFTLSTDDGTLVLDEAWMRIRLSPAQTAAFAYGDTLPAWKTCKAYVYVTRADGTIEPQYLVTFNLTQGTPIP